MSFLDYFKFKVRKGRLLGCSLQAQEIIIPNRVKAISTYAFSFNNASKVIIPDNVIELENNSFSNNKYIRYVKISDNTHLGDGVFLESKNLEEVILPSNIDILPISTFSGCEKLSKINRLYNLQVIGDRAFYGCENLKEFKFSFSINKLQPYSFAETGLECVDLSNSRIREISSGTFAKCKKLKEVITNKSLRCIESEAFAECRLLHKVVLNEGLLKISKQAFKATRIESIDIPNTVLSIGYRAFFFCDYLTNVTLSDSLIKLEEQAFAQCKNLENIILPQSLEVLGKEAFLGCKNLYEVKIPIKVEFIEKGTFANCISLRRIILENSDIILEKGAFSFCCNLKEIIYKGKNINVSNIEVSTIDNEVLDFLINNGDKLRKIEARVDIETLKELAKQNLLEDFCLNGYYKNYRNLYNLLFIDGKGNIENKRAFFSICYTLGVFNRELSQKSSVILTALIQNKIITANNIVKLVCNLDVALVDEEMIKEITENNGTFLYDISLYSKQNEGFLSKCLTYYHEVQFTNTTNKGEHRRLKPTLNKFINYFKTDKFQGIETREDEELSIEIGKFFDKQEIFDKAKKVMAKFKEEGIVDSLINEQVRKEKFEEIAISKRRFLASNTEIKKYLNNLHYEFLRKSDPVNFTIGKYCNLCCAHIEGLGENICFASILDDNSQTLVLKNDFNEIISKATFTINVDKQSIIINSIQTNDNLSKGNERNIALKYLETMKLFIKNYNSERKNKINNVFLGTKRSMLVEEFKDATYGFCESIDYNKYSYGKSYQGDWKENQICIYDSKIILK